MNREELKVLHDRAVQVFIAKLGERYKEDIRNVGIDSTGEIYINYLVSRGCCGDPDEYDYEYLKNEDFTTDLDVLIEKRKKEEAEKAEKERIRRETEQKEREHRDRENRRMAFIKLKREFEP